MYITLYPQISSFVAVNNYSMYQSDNFRHKTNTPLVALGEWPTEDTLSREVEIRKSYLKLEFTEHITHTLMANLSSSAASHIHILHQFFNDSVVWSAKGDGIVLKGKFQVYLLSDDTYRWN